MLFSMKCHLRQLNVLVQVTEWRDVCNLSIIKVLMMGTMKYFRPETIELTSIIACSVMSQPSGDLNQPVPF